MEKITCVSCGASFSGSESKCPYCGTLNEVGAEKEYGRKLEHIRKRLDVVDDIAERNFKDELKQFARALGITLIVLFAITIAVTVFYLTVVRLGESSANSVKVKNQEAVLASFHEKQIELDCLYDEGRYDEMCEMMDGLDKEYRNFAYYWKHYYFYEAYTQKIKCEKDMAGYLESPESTYRYTSAIHNSFVFYYYAFGGNYADRISEEETVVLEKIWEEFRSNVCSTLEIEEEEFDDLLNQSTQGGSYPNYDYAKDYVNERFGK